MKQLTGSLTSHLKLVGHKWREMARAFSLYKQSPKFLRIDLELLRLYFLKSPYHLSADKTPFGETSPSLMKEMAKAFRWRSTDKFLELGCGTGRPALWLHQHLELQVRGVDLSKPFIDRAKHLVKRLDLKGISFEEGDLLSADFSWPTIIYFYSTAFDEALVTAVAEKCRELPEGAQVITISAPLKSPHLYLYKRLEVRFPWGKTFAFCHKKTNNLS